MALITLNFNKMMMNLVLLAVFLNTQQVYANNDTSTDTNSTDETTTPPTTTTTTTTTINNSTTTTTTMAASSNATNSTTTTTTEAVTESAPTCLKATFYRSAICVTGSLSTDLSTNTADGLKVNDCHYLATGPTDNKKKKIMIESISGTCSGLGSDGLGPVVTYKYDPNNEGEATDTCTTTETETFATLDSLTTSTAGACDALTPKPNTDDVYILFECSSACNAVDENGNTVELEDVSSSVELTGVSVPDTCDTQEKLMSTACFAVLGNYKDMLGVGICEAVKDLTGVSDINCATQLDLTVSIVARRVLMNNNGLNSISNRRSLAASTVNMKVDYIIKNLPTTTAATIATSLSDASTDTAKQTQFTTKLQTEAATYATKKALSADYDISSATFTLTTATKVAAGSGDSGAGATGSVSSDAVPRLRSMNNNVITFIMGTVVTVFMGFGMM